MDSFCSLFDPADDNQNKTNKNNNPLDTAKKKTKGRRGRGRKSQSKSDSVPEESSFLCEPELDCELLMRDASYIDSFIRPDESPCEMDKRSRRRVPTRKFRRRSRPSPSERDDTVWNNRSTPPRSVDQTLGKNVNDISSLPLLNKLEKVSINDLQTDSDDSDTNNVCNIGRLPPEPRFGNVEYKLQLVQPSDTRFQHLVTQLKWRLVSGAGRAIYVVGVRDCGQVVGLRGGALRASLRTLRAMARRLAARLASVAVRRVAAHAALAEVHIQRLAETQQSVELRVAVMGANEAGKSTLVGVLTQGELDNGHGSARLNMFRHLHEVRSGRTSSLSHEILGFDAQGKVVNYGCSELMTAERIGERSAKLVCFLDLAGHTKYQRTTLHGLSAYCPHAAMLLISATAGITHITQDHLKLLLALEVPFFVVITKSELAATSAGILAKLDQLLAGRNKKPLLVSDEKILNHLVVKPQNLLLDHMNEQTNNNTCNTESEIIPVFPVSCVRGTGLSSLHAYLLALQPPIYTEHHQLQDSCEFQIDEIFHMSRSDEAVVGGFLVTGVLYEGDVLLLGPLECGSFRPCAVVSVHMHRVRCARAAAGHSASLLLRTSHPPRPGMTLLSKKQPPETSKSESAPNNRKTIRRKATNLLQDIKTAENILTKNNIDKINIYHSDSDEEKPFTTLEQKINNVVASSRSDIDNVRIDVDSDSDRNEVNVDSDEVVSEDPYNPRGCIYFQASVEILQHTTSISVGFQCTVHVGNVRQTAVIEGIMAHSGSLREGEKASCMFRLTRAPEYLVRGRRLMFTAGHGTRAIGRITQVFPYTP